MSAPNIRSGLTEARGDPAARWDLGVISWSGKVVESRRRRPAEVWRGQTCDPLKTMAGTTQANYSKSWGHKFAYATLALLALLWVNAFAPAQVVSTSSIVNKTAALLIINTPLVVLLLSFLFPKSPRIRATRWIMLVAGILTITFSILFSSYYLRHLHHVAKQSDVECGPWRFWHELDARIQSVYQRVEGRRRMLPGVELRRILLVKPAGQTEITIIPRSGCDQVELHYTTLGGNAMVLLDLN